MTRVASTWSSSYLHSIAKERAALTVCAVLIFPAFEPRFSHRNGWTCAFGIGNTGALQC